MILRTKRQQFLMVAVVGILGLGISGKAHGGIWKTGCPCTCPPYQSDYFGYFATQWRPWPVNVSSNVAPVPGNISMPPAARLEFDAPLPIDKPQKTHVEYPKLPPVSDQNKLPKPASPYSSGAWYS